MRHHAALRLRHPHRQRADTPARQGDHHRSSTDEAHRPPHGDSQRHGDGHTDVYRQPNGYGHPETDAHPTYAACGH